MTPLCKLTFDDSSIEFVLKALGYRIGGSKHYIFDHKNQPVLCSNCDVRLTADTLGGFVGHRPVCKRLVCLLLST